MTDDPLRPPFVVGVDVGGTFTDVALLDADGRVRMAKAATTPADRAKGVLDALENAAAACGMSLAELLAKTRRITHGSTIATNALLTRSGPTLGLVTTRGFEDTPAIMRAIGRVDGLSEEQVRHPAALTKPVPLVERRRTAGVYERIDARGNVVVPLRDDDVLRALERLVETEKVGGLAVCLLNAWANPAHEERVAALMAERYGDDAPYLSVSHRLARVAGEYARTNTALVDALVGPVVQRYLRRLEDELRRRGFAGDVLAMQGNGGLAHSAECTPVGTLQSGPAGGMLAAAHVAKLLGHERVLTADMGGTSFDVGIYVDGTWTYADEPIFDRFRILQPIIEVDSIGAGGGTIARYEEATARLVVGPESAGADPGPACYAMGGEEPTITDANVALGVIDPAYFLGGKRTLDAARAHDAVARVGRRLGLDVRAAADGIRRIIEGKMADLIRRQVIRSGHLPEQFVLYAFGGASGMHAAALAKELGIPEVYVFPTSAVFSAFGIALADVRHTRLLTVEVLLPCAPAALNGPLDTVAGDLLAVMEREGFAGGDVRIRRYASCRYLRQTQAVELELPAGPLDDGAIASLGRRFVERYAALYGVGAGDPNARVEVSALRIDAIGPVAKPELAGAGERGAGAATAKGRRLAQADGTFGETDVYDWDALVPGQSVAGPAIVESPFTTVVVPPGSAGTVDAYRDLVIGVGR